MDLSWRIVWVRRSEGSWPALKARHLVRPSIYMLNSFRFSGRTSWPGGWEPEIVLRYPARMSIDFSVSALRMSFNGRSVILVAAGKAVSGLRRLDELVVTYLL